MSQSQKGQNNPMYGKHHSAEARRKIGEASKKRGISKETRAKMRVKLIGQHRTEETKRKISESKKGNNNPNYGKHLIAETCKKMSESRTGKNHYNYGKHLSVETRQKQSATKQGIFYDEWERFAIEQEYCPKFDDQCRQSNRDKYNNECFICGLPADKNIDKHGNVRKLSVHHVDMQKEQGCKGNRWKLIPVCLYHHPTLHTRLWEARIIYLLNNVYTGASMHPPVKTTQ